MARSDGEAAFDNFVTQNQQAFMKHRGATSPYKQINADPGLYYAQIIDAERDTQEVETKDANGGKTGLKVLYGRVRYRVSLVASADPKMPHELLERFAGEQGFITYLIPPVNNDDAIQRLYSDLAEMGINTQYLVLRQADIQDPSTQFTLAQVLDLLQEQKPCCTVAISQKSATDPKYINYRKAVPEEDIVALLGHPIGQNIQTYETQSQAPAQQHQPMMGQGQPMVQQPDRPMVNVGQPMVPQVQPGRPMVQPMVQQPMVQPQVHQPQVQQPMVQQVQQPMVQQPVQSMEPVWEPENNRWFNPADNNYYDANGNYLGSAAPPVQKAPPFQGGVPMAPVMSRPTPPMPGR